MQMGMPLEYVKRISARFVECDDHKKWYGSTYYSADYFSGLVGGKDLFDPSDLNHIGCEMYQSQINLGGGYRITARVKPTAECGVPSVRTYTQVNCRSTANFVSNVVHSPFF